MLVEVRVSPGKGKLKRTIQDIQHESRIGNGRSIPHLTLYGPFRAYDSRLRNVINAIEKVGKNYDCLPYVVDGFDWKKHPDGRGKFIYFCIKPSSEFESFSDELRYELQKIAPSYKDWDQPGSKFLYHITVATHLNGKFGRAWSYINGEKSLISRLLSLVFGAKQTRPLKDFYLPLCGLRITLLNDKRRIAYEYDLMGKRTLNRAEALNRGEYKKTLQLFRTRTGQQLLEPAFEKDASIYLIGDLHLDHENIIKYCARPFADVEEMNDVLLNNWNYSIKENDKVYYLGDLVFGKSSRKPSYWKPLLKGDIEFIQGNHDRKLGGAKESEILDYGGERFLLCHYPKRPAGWDGWLVHGHTHNNDLRNYPFINGEKKTINVSVELIGYKPLSMEKLLALDINSIKRMDTLSSKPERKSS